MTAGWTGLKARRDKRLRIEVQGVVQGVGFRPFVYALACEGRLAGFVRNCAAGVEIEVEGERTALDAFVANLRSQAPPLAVIAALSAEEVPLRGEGLFTIMGSREGGRSTHLSPDVSTCDDCRRELADPGDRRYLYPFINCTNCGPRYSITRAVPYDRARTTMAPFALCADCRREYEDPRDRRFHAEPNACPVCGPAVVFSRSERRERGRAAIEAAVALLQEGGIVAVKGIGGYHLAVAAARGEAVRRLRERKRRSNKAFALMAPDIEGIRVFAEVSGEEEALLCSKERPIVLLRRREGAGLPEAVAPGVPEVGFMLPYSPLHFLLFSQKPRGEEGRGANFPALVMTSGNLSEEPVVRDNAAAEEKLAPIADAFLHHDREIFMRVDDSVVRRFGGETVFVRRARGYVPSAISLDGQGPQLLACGADVKNTFTLTTGDAAVVSQHIGDMENLETLHFFEETLANLKGVYRIEPAALAHDLHPGYFSTRWAREQEGVEKYGIQHHHAHVGSVMAEKGIGGKVIGVALDGSGYGEDGTVWGGEFLLADPYGFERLARFRAVPMPGSEAAVRRPWQMALSYLADAFGGEAMEVAERIGLVGRQGSGDVEMVLRIINDRSLSPLTSGAGRLFESLASLIGVGDVNTFEGEAAMALEAAVVPGVEERYRYDFKDGHLAELDFSATVREVVRDLANREGKGTVAARFHNTVAAAVVDTACRLQRETGIADVVLTGGVFQNRCLLGKVIAGLTTGGLRPHFNSRVPANDAGISLGQAFILRARLGGSGPDV